MHTEAGWPFCIEIAGLLLWTKACISPALVAVVQPVGICNIETWRAFLRILTLMGVKSLSFDTMLFWVRSALTSDRAGWLPRSGECVRHSGRSPLEGVCRYHLRFLGFRESF